MLGRRTESTLATRLAMSGSRAADWRLLTPAPGELRVVFACRVLRYEAVRVLFDWLLNDRRQEWHTITFDFARVHEIAAPWAPVFAHLAYVAQRTRAECPVLGLNPRLAAMLSFAVGSPVPGNLRLNSAGAVGGPYTTEACS